MDKANVYKGSHVFTPLNNVAWVPYRKHCYHDLQFKILRKSLSTARATKPLFDYVLHCLSDTSDPPAVENRVQR